MVSWTALLLPALLSGVLVFIASSVIHMVLKLHHSDYKKLSNEDEVRAAIRKGSPAPGQYVTPHCGDMKEMASPEMQKKYVDGPIAVITLRANGPIQMGPLLGKWFVYSVVVALLAGYVGRVALAPNADFMHVFRVVGAAAWLGFAWQSPADAIWMGKPWAATAKTLFDGFVYAAATGAMFAWLWPR